MIKKQRTTTVPEHYTGVSIMHDPYFNKVSCRHAETAIISHPLARQGTGFSEREKDRLGLRGLVPPVTNAIEQQTERIYSAFHAYDLSA